MGDGTIDNLLIVVMGHFPIPYYVGKTGGNNQIKVSSFISKRTKTEDNLLKKLVPPDIGCGWAKCATSNKHEANWWNNRREKWNIHFMNQRKEHLHAQRGSSDMYGIQPVNMGYKSLQKMKIYIIYWQSSHVSGFWLWNICTFFWATWPGNTVFGDVRINAQTGTNMLHKFIHVSCSTTEAILVCWVSRSEIRCLFGWLLVASKSTLRTMTTMTSSALYVPAMNRKLLPWSWWYFRNVERLHDQTQATELCIKIELFQQIKLKSHLCY